MTTSTTSISPLLVEVLWDDRKHGKDLVYRAHFELEPAPDAANAIVWVMGGAVGAMQALRQQADALEQACGEMTRVAEAECQSLDGVASRKEEMDGDAAVKTAALLASKQEHLAQLLRQVEGGRGRWGYGR